MTTYKSYAECKIANPDSDIVTTGKDWQYEKETVGTFEARAFDEDDGAHIIADDAWVICNPADHCSSLKEFLESGFEFSVGDFWLNEDGDLLRVDLVNGVTNKYQYGDENRYILSAAALNGGCKIPAKAEQWTVYSNTLPLCDLTDEQVGKLVKNSGCVEHMNPNDGVWNTTITPMWNMAGVYRIKSKSERELFIEAAASTFDGRTGLSEQAMSLAAQLMFDSGKFKRVIKDGE